MSDQSVRITNLPDSGSPARVAYDLYSYLRGTLAKGGSPAETAKRHLDLYAECLNAARGLDHDTSKLT